MDISLEAAWFLTVLTQEIESYVLPKAQGVVEMVLIILHDIIKISSFCLGYMCIATYTLHFIENTSYVADA